MSASIGPFIVCASICPVRDRLFATLGSCRLGEHVFHRLVAILLNIALRVHRFYRKEAEVRTRPFGEAHIDTISSTEHDWITARLRSYPYWRSGHYRLAHLALEVRDMNLAYASALAVRKLSSSPRSLAESALLESHVCNRSMHYVKAREVLGAVPERLRGSRHYAELFAAHVGLMDWKGALLDFEKIPASDRTPELLSAADFVRGKLHTFATKTQE